MPPVAALACPARSPLARRPRWRGGALTLGLAAIAPACATGAPVELPPAASTGGTTVTDAANSTGPAATAAQTGTTGGDASTADASSSAAQPLDLGSEPSSATGPTDVDAAQPRAVVVYPADRLHSPVPPGLVARWRGRVRGSAARVAKTGASSTVSRAGLWCLGATDVALGAIGHLEPTRAAIASEPIAGTNPFQRASLAAAIGKTAAWAVAGDPSPLAQELRVAAPGVVLVHFAANDMQLGTTPIAALPTYVASMDALLHGVDAAGALPLVLGPTRRTDTLAGARDIGLYRAAARALAERHQVPFVDLWLASDGLPAHGLASDGLHPSADPRGSCRFDEDGLTFGYTVRNAVTLAALQRVREALVHGLAADPAAPPARGGLGHPADPRRATTLPYAESIALGPGDLPWTIALTLGAPTPLRWVVVGPGFTLAPVTPTTGLEEVGPGEALSGTWGPGELRVEVRRAEVDPSPTVGLVIAVPCEPEDERCAAVFDAARAAPEPLRAAGPGGSRSTSPRSRRPPD